MTIDTDNSPRTVLIVGASRGLGEAMAAEFLAKGWDVVGTVRGVGSTGLHDLATAHAGRVGIEQLDITVAGEIAALRRRLAGRTFDMLFVNAGTANHDQRATIAQTATEEYVRVVTTNALGVMRTVEGLQDLVHTDGTIGVMSSGQGSLANNLGGGDDVYRASKAALNQHMRSYAARHADGARALVLAAPGWVRTALGGAGAPLGIADSIPPLVAMLIAQRGRPGLRYLDRHGQTVPW